MSESSREIPVVPSKYILSLQPKEIKTGSLSAQTRENSTGLTPKAAAQTKTKPRGENATESSVPPDYSVETSLGKIKIRFSGPKQPIFATIAEISYRGISDFYSRLGERVDPSRNKGIIVRYEGTLDMAVSQRYTGETIPVEEIIEFIVCSNREMCTEGYLRLRLDDKRITITEIEGEDKRPLGNASRAADFRLIEDVQKVLSQFSLTETTVEIPGPVLKQLQENIRQQIIEVEKVEAEKRKRQLEAQAAYEERKNAAEVLYSRYRKLLTDSGRLKNFALDRAIFQGDLDFAELSRKHVVELLAERVDPGSLLNNLKFIEHLETFIRRVQIGHNYDSDRERFGIQADLEAKQVGRLKSDLTTAINIPPETTILSCVLVDPKSESTRRFGTGWGGDTIYLFDIEKFAQRSLVFPGDIDSPDSFYSLGGPERWKKTFMTVEDAILSTAVQNWEDQQTSMRNRSPHYDEILVFGDLDLKGDSVSSIKLQR